MHEYHRPDLEKQDINSNRIKIANDLKRLMGSSGIIIDVGANCGQFAEEIIENLPISKIYCLEPVPAAFDALSSLSSLHPEIVPVKKAVARGNGTASFFVTESDVGSSLLKPLSGQPSKWLTLSHELTVETIRLDDFIRQKLSTETFASISLLKSDAQGCDLDVLLSAGDFLNPNCIQAILVEINFSTFYAGQQPFHEIFALLDKAGYRMAWMYPHRAHDEWLWWADALFIGKDS